MRWWRSGLFADAETGPVAFESAIVALTRKLIRP